MKTKAAVLACLLAFSPAPASSAVALPGTGMALETSLVVTVKGIPNALADSCTLRLTHPLVPPFNPIAEEAASVWQTALVPVLALAAGAPQERSGAATPYAPSSVPTKEDVERGLAARMARDVLESFSMRLGPLGGPLAAHIRQTFAACVDALHAAGLVKITSEEIQNAPLEGPPRHSAPPRPR